VCLKIAIYSKGKKQDVTLVLTYAEIPFTAYDEEVLSDQLLLYDWFYAPRRFTGQYGKFGAYQNTYIDKKKKSETLAQKLGFNKVSEEKAVYLKD
jgi:hypothetical protein